MLVSFSLVDDLSIGVSCDDQAYVINKLNSFGQPAYSKPDIVYAQVLGSESEQQLVLTLSGGELSWYQVSTDSIYLTDS